MLSVGQWLSTLLLLAVVSAQEPKQPAAADPERVRIAIAAWLASQQDDQGLLDQTVAVILAEPTIGLRELGAQVTGIGKTTSAAKTRALRSLATHCALEFVRQQVAAELVFVGQYAPLQPLQPFVGELFFGLLLQTPDWYPDTHRIQLVAPLRELQPTRPAAAIADAVVAMVRNEVIEPHDLRLALACMLWQWGDKVHARAELDRLQQESGEGGPEDRIDALRRLREVWYSLRDHKQAAAVHQGMRVMAERGKIALTPTDWYSAACSFALSGQVVAGLEALGKCAELQASPDVDKSLKLARKLFDNDPEIDALRGDARFAKIVEQAFSGPAREPGAGKDR
ncbi:MAG: hypothetical protein IPK26_18855 [Planctomycetes bacterium]|nr:hypothetical protein [Planctomycetota bacterium]